MIKPKCRCGKEKDEGRSYCPDCLQKHREYQRKYDSKKRELKQPRNCSDCGTEIPQSPPKRGRPQKRCLKCANEAVIRSSIAYRERNISLGRCPCGKDRSVDSTYYCPNCLVSRRKYQREYRNRKAAQNQNQKPRRSKS